MLRCLRECRFQDVKCFQEAKRHERADSNPHGRLWSADHRFQQEPQVHRRPAGKAVRPARRHQIRLQHHGPRLQVRGYSLACRARAADARLPVGELPDRPGAGTRLRRPAVPVLLERAGARRDGRRARRLSRQEDRGSRELPHPRLVRKRLPPHLQPAPADPHARRYEGHEDSRAAERDPPPHLRIDRRDADAHGPDRRDRHGEGRHARRAGKSARQHGHLWRAQIPQVPHAVEPLLYLAADLFPSRRLRVLAEGLAGRDARRGEGRRRLPARTRGRGARAVAPGDRG